MNIDRMKNIRLGEVLIAGGYITEEQLQKALVVQKESQGKRLGEVLVELGFVSERHKLEALSKRCGLPLVSIEKLNVNVDAVARVPLEMAEKYKLLAVDITNGKLVVVINDPLNFFAIEDVRQIVKMPVELNLDSTASIERAIGFYYSEVSARRAVSEANKAVAAPVSLATQDLELITATTSDAPVVKLLNSLLVKGYNTNASDIHIEPFEEKLNVRIRVDGAIIDYTVLSLNIHQPLIARIKIMSNLDIAEKRVPQDGHFRVVSEGIDLNVRVSLIPTVYGEKAVLRFLSTNSAIDNSGTFGMNEADYAKMLSALDSPHGIIYMTGPTGSGKTTTLYMLLERLRQRKVNISTIEDPVERNIARVNQMQVNNMAGLTFDIGLRALMRQDPDIIMVGETRDAETASISVRAAITGHLVLSTLHTNDAVSSVVRLEDMGVPSYMVASSLVSVVAQRLVRKICPDCAETYVPGERDIAIIGFETNRLYRGRGCPRCNNTGYKGRIAVHEILLIDKYMRGLITRGASTDEMFEYARNGQKMTTLRESATNLLIQGVTSIEELLKTAYYEGA